jgi:hypothetical protein
MLPALPEALPGGREVVLTAAQPMPPSGSTPEPTPGAAFPMPRENPELGPSQIPVGSPASSSGGGDDGCTLGASGGASPWGLLLLAAAAARLRRAGRA